MGSKPVLVTKEEDRFSGGGGTYKVRTPEGWKFIVVPPRPDYRWEPSAYGGRGGRVRQTPEHGPHPFPAPPRVPVLVPSDIADDVRAYAHRREAEKELTRGTVGMMIPCAPEWFTRGNEVWRRLGR